MLLTPDISLYLPLSAACCSPVASVAPLARLALITRAPSVRYLCDLGKRLQGPPRCKCAYYDANDDVFGYS
jgi:hypothetical protein